ncbi:MAG: protein kinase [Deltaproteobacteria bacterium]|nr:protein kinase [Deltaproteobacteria bacterium]
MNHVDVRTVLAFADGEAGPEVEAHLRRCARCRDLAAVVGLELDPPRPEATIAESLYEDIRLHERGGMGEVYLARDRRLQREVILKMPPRASDGVRYLKLAARLEHERSVLAQLNHPAIPPVFEGGQLGAEGEPFFAMPIAGIETLTKAVGRLETLEARVTLLPSMISVAEGVAYAHRRGVIHRDIKPDHVLLGAEGEARLIDWGLAKLEGDAPEGLPIEDGAGGRRGELLATVQGLYTEGYSPPEQQRGAPAEKHFDVYALGATLFFLVTGRHPGGPSPERSAFPSGCPRDLIKIVRRAMHVDPSARYPDAGALTQVLKRFQAGRLVHPSLPQRVLHWVRRRAAPLTVAAMLGVLVVAWVVVSETSHAYQSRLERTAQEARDRAAANGALERTYAQLLDDFRSLESTSTATIAALNARLLEVRHERGRLERRAAGYRDDRDRVEQAWVATTAELGRAGDRAEALTAQARRLEADAVAARAELERSEGARAVLERRLSEAEAQLAHREAELALRARQGAPADDAEDEDARAVSGASFGDARGPFGLRRHLPNINLGPGQSPQRLR